MCIRDSTICNGSGIVSPVEQTETAFASQVGGDHYQGMSIQPALFITKNKIPFLEGCVIKRMCRHRLKNKAEDIRKAIQELRMILELEYGETEGGEKIQ